MHKRPIFFLAVNIMALLVLTACTAATLPTVTNTTRPLPSTTPTLVPPTSTPVPSPTTPPVLGYSSLPDGEYLIYETPFEIGALLLDGQTQTLLVDKERIGISYPAGALHGTGGAILSPNLQQAVLIPWHGHRGYVFDLTTGQKSEYPFLKDCYSATLSMDNQDFLATCDSEISGGVVVYLISVDGSERTPICNFLKEYRMCEQANFSPDGEWLTYYVHTPQAGPISPADGVYLVETSCINQATCDSAKSGPFPMNFQYVWSTNSQYLATRETDAIVIYQLKGEAFQKIKSIEIEPDVYAYFDDPVWSPDSTQLAYASWDGKIFIVSFDGSEIRKIEPFHDDAALLGWVVIKDGEVVR
jgi:WD40 repeat protein